MAKHNEIGKIGEDIVSKWLISRGFEVVERNYRQKWGEIDIVARLPGRQTGKTEGKVHFVEVKSVSYETKADLERAVSHGTWRPEENVHTHKQERLRRAIQTWIAEHKHEGEFQIDVISVRLVPREKIANVKLIENVIFE